MVLRDLCIIYIEIEKLKRDLSRDRDRLKALKQRQSSSNKDSLSVI